MAAPTLAKAESNIASDEKTKQKQKKELKKQKNVLFNPFPYKWPVLDKYFEGRILDELQSLLKSLPLQLPKRSASYFKSLKKGTEDGQLDPDEKKKCDMQKELRSQIVCGVREVTKGLERDILDLILVCRSTQPAIITKHLIPLAASRGCPALCIPEFNPKIAPLLGVTSLVAFGFKKLPQDRQSKFREFITYAKSVAPSLDTPWVNKTLGISCLGDSKTLTESSQDEASIQGRSGSDDKGDSGIISAAQSTGDFISLSTTDLEVSQSDKSPSKKNNDSSGFGSFYGSPGNRSGFISLTFGEKENEQFGIVTNKADNSTSDKSNLLTAKEISDKIPKGSSLVFPLDGPPPFVPKRDYSHLYVFKKQGKFGDNFIPLGGSKGIKRELSNVSFGSESDSVEEEEDRVLGLEEPVAKKPKHLLDKGAFKNYQPAIIRTQIPNLNKKQKRQMKRKQKK